MMRKLVILGVSVICALLIAMPAKATPLPYSGDGYIGRVTPDAPAAPADDANYISYLISLSPGTTDTTGTYEQSYYRSETAFSPSLPSVGNLYAYGDISDATELTLPTGSWYIIAKYDAEKAGGYVWYETGGVFTIPEFDPTGKYRVSNYRVYSVPEPSTFLLIGSGLVGIATLRRKSSK